MTIRRVDANQKAITMGLRRIGAFVQPIHTVGRGCPDLLVAYGGRWFIAEIKTRNGTLTDDEIEWHERATRQAPVFVWRTLEDALKDVKT